MIFKSNDNVFRATNQYDRIFNKLNWNMLVNKHFIYQGSWHFVAFLTFRKLPFCWNCRVWNAGKLSPMADCRKWLNITPTVVVNDVSFALPMTCQEKFSKSCKMFSNSSFAPWDCSKCLNSLLLELDISSWILCNIYKLKWWKLNKKDKWCCVCFVISLFSLHHFSLSFLPLLNLGAKF